MTANQQQEQPGRLDRAAFENMQMEALRSLLEQHGVGVATKHNAFDDENSAVKLTRSIGGRTTVIGVEATLFFDAFYGALVTAADAGWFDLVTAEVSQ